VSRCLLSLTNVSEDILQHGFVQAQVGQQALELGVLFLELL
jgi:hypothetical protein